MVEHISSFARRNADWPMLRRAAWTALFIAILGWSSMMQPPPPIEVLPWTGWVAA